MPTILRPATCVTQSPAVDSRRWDRFEPRADDIVIATYPKSGTTWMQRIVDMLVFQSTEPRDINALSPWLDSRLFATIEEDLAKLAAQTHRRFVKSHLPFDSLPVYDTVKYVHVARDGRDACMSFHNHLMAMKPEVFMRIGANAMEDGLQGPPPPPPPQDLRDYYLQWIEQAEAGGVPPGNTFFDFENTYWHERARPNLLMVHYNDMKADLEGEVRRLAAFLDIETPPALVADIARAGEFSAMKAQGGRLLPGIDRAFEGGKDRFLHKGTNGQWRDVLTAEDVARFDALVRKKFSPGCAAWMQNGGLAAGDPRNLAD